MENEIEIKSQEKITEISKHEFWVEFGKSLKRFLRIWKIKFIIKIWKI